MRQAYDYNMIKIQEALDDYFEDKTFELMTESETIIPFSYEEHDALLFFIHDTDVENIELIYDHMGESFLSYKNFKYVVEPIINTKIENNKKYIKTFRLQKCDKELERIALENE